MCNYLKRYSECTVCANEKGLYKNNTWLKQSDIDRPEHLRQKPGMFESWWDAIPCLVSTVVVLIAIAAGAYGFYLWWTVAEKMVSAAVRG